MEGRDVVEAGEDGLVAADGPQNRADRDQEGNQYGRLPQTPA